MNLKKQAIIDRIKIIRLQLNFLERYKSIDKKDFVDDLEKINASQRALNVIIGACLDIGNHIITANRWNDVNTYADIFRILEKNGVIEKDLAGNLVKMAKFRNLLSHNYLILNNAEILTIIKTRLKDVKSFVKVVLTLLPEQ